MWRQANADSNNRELVVDVKGLTVISEDGENVLLDLMKEGASFRSAGLITKQILKQLAREVHRSATEANT